VFGVALAIVQWAHYVAMCTFCKLFSNLTYCVNEIFLFL